MGADQNTAILDAINRIDNNRREDGLELKHQIEKLTDICYKLDKEVAVVKADISSTNEKLDSHIESTIDSRKQEEDDNNIWKKIKKHWQLICFLILLGRATVPFDSQISNTLGINEPEHKSTTIDSTKIKQHNSINEKLIKGLIGAAADDTNIKIKYN